MTDSSLPRSVTVRAGTNIALVKYWGKRDKALNLPAAGSLSLTLAELGSETTVRFAADVGESDGRDRVVFGGSTAAPRFADRVRRFLDLVRVRAGIHLPAEVVTANTVPTAAGLASSAAGFAALALSASRAAGLRLSPAELSELARRGSGSAARSIFGGFAEMSAGSRADGSDAVAHDLLDEGAWDVRLCVAITAEGAKAIGSTAAMESTAQTSPYYHGWLASVPTDLSAARTAVQAARPLQTWRRGRAQRLAHARLRHGRGSSYSLLEPSDAGRDCDGETVARLWNAGIFHHRRRPPRQSLVCFRRCTFHTSGAGRYPRCHESFIACAWPRRAHR